MLSAHSWHSPTQGFSKAISSKGCLKATLGSVNIPVEVLATAAKRESFEGEKRAKFVLGAE